MTVASRDARFDQLTSLRGIAALLVVVFHARGQWHPILSSGEKYSMIIANGPRWVDFFFVLSGFVMMLAYGNVFRQRVQFPEYRSFLINRFGRIYPMHALTLGLCILTGMLGFNDGLWRPEGAIWRSLVLLQGFTIPAPPGDFVYNYPSWSISTEWYAYVLFPVIAMGVSRVRTNGVLIAFSLCFVAALSFVFHFRETLGPITNLMSCVIQFALGTLAYRAYALRMPSIHSRVLAVLFVVAPALLICLPKSLSPPDLELLLPGMFAFSIFILASSPKPLIPWLTSAPLTFLGEISYSVYMNHAVLAALVQAASFHFAGDRLYFHHGDMTTALVGCAVYLLVVIAVSALTYRYVEVPCRAFFKSLSRPTTMPKPVGVARG